MRVTMWQFGLGRLFLTRLAIVAIGLQQLVTHYRRSKVVSDDLRVSLKALKCRLIAGRQPTVTAGHLAVWYVYADASFACEQTSKSAVVTLQILWG